MKLKFILVFLFLFGLLFTQPAIAKGKSLAAPALKSCQARESVIKTRMDNLTRLTLNIEDVFNKIAMRVEDFYTNKILPSGKSVPNYDALVSDIAAKKGIADADLAAAQTLESSFSCTTDDPRSLLTQFRLDMQKVKTDLKNYRTSIKNLIVAVRPLAPEGTEEPEATGTPEATPTP